MSKIRETLKNPYWAMPDTSDIFQNFTDFSRETIQTGVTDVFPDGVFGLRVDDDFWVVAALPLSYKDVPVEEIIADLWPNVTEYTIR